MIHLGKSFISVEFFRRNIAALYWKGLSLTYEFLQIQNVFVQIRKIHFLTAIQWNS